MQGSEEHREYWIESLIVNGCMREEEVFDSLPKPMILNFFFNHLITIISKKNLPINLLMNALRGYYARSSSKLRMLWPLLDVFLNQYYFWF